MVRARGLVKTFGDGRAERRVLDGADLDVDPGEVVAILGRSGSGDHGGHLPTVGPSIKPRSGARAYFASRSSAAELMQ